MSGTSEGPTPATELGRAVVTESEILAPSGAEFAEFAEGAEAVEVAGPVPDEAVEPDASPVPCTPSPPSYRSVFTAAPLAMAVVDREGTVTGANAALADLLGRDQDTLTGAVAADLVDLASDARTWHAYRELLRGRRARLRCTRRLKHPQGHALWVRVTVAPLPADDGGVLVSVADISDHRALQARLRHLRMHDPVTRLPNRTLFFERLTGALEAESYAESGTGRIGLCYLDLDGFKAVNDTLGHRVGDQLLAAVADRLTRCAQDAGRARAGIPLVARLGGDEFALLVEDSTGTEQLADLAESLLDAIQEPFDLSGRRLSVSASIGVVERHAAGTTPTALMQAADTTLYWAKADGKARWTLFDPERNASRVTRQALVSSLRPAIDRGEFALEYQPLVGMDDDRVHGVEALIRWHHPRFGTLTPNRFISLAEEDGSIVPLGRWVLRTACRQARDWQTRYPDEPPIFVSVNVAVRQVWDSDLVADVADTLEETGLPPHLLQLELTESAVMGSSGRPAPSPQGAQRHGRPHRHRRLRHRLLQPRLPQQASGVRAEARRLLRPGLPDRGPHGAARRRRRGDRRGDGELAHRLGLTVTAECVETSAQATRLRRIGCDTGQGWLYSRPVPPDRISELLGTPGVQAGVGNP
ncbi:EAL domain-containing protein OS=Streptomyces tendae OX=1932 GN=F3L20_27410 PE=4 SV=1 [Streptomyces tendae]